MFVCTLSIEGTTGLLYPGNPYYPTSILHGMGIFVCLHQSQHCLGSFLFSNSPRSISGSFSTKGWVHRYTVWVVVYLFSPLFGEDEPILTNIFQRGSETTNQPFIFYKGKSRGDTSSPVLMLSSLDIYYHHKGDRFDEHPWNLTLWKYMEVHGRNTDAI